MTEKINIHPLHIRLAFSKRMRRAFVEEELTGEETLKFTKIFDEPFQKLIEENETRNRGYRCTHPCVSKHPEKPVCPLARNQEEAENWEFPGYCLDEDPDEQPCEWLEEIDLEQAKKEVEG